MTFQPVNSLLSWFIATEWKHYFPQSMHCALLESVWPNKPPLLNTLSTEADVHGVQKVLSVLKNCKTFSPRPRPRPRLHDPRLRPRLSVVSPRRLETKTLVSRTTSLRKIVVIFNCTSFLSAVWWGLVYSNTVPCSSTVSHLTQPTILVNRQIIAENCTVL